MKKVNTSLTDKEYWDNNESGLNYPAFKISYSDREAARVFHKAMESKRGGNILELGCGGSYFLPYFVKKYQMKPAGIDFSERQLKIAVDNLKGNGDLRCKDIYEIQYDWIKSFDVVYSRGFIEHFTTPAEIIEICLMYMKPDGIMITTVPHLKGFSGFIKDNNHYRMNLKDLRNMHTINDLEVIKSSYFRLLDFSVVNWSGFPLIIVRYISLCMMVSSVIRRYIPDIKIPCGYFYADMIVISRRK